MKVSRHDQALAVALEHVAWMRAEGWSIAQAIEALPWRYRPAVTSWDDVSVAYARAWLEAQGRKAA